MIVVKRTNHRNDECTMCTRFIRKENETSPLWRIESDHPQRRMVIVLCDLCLGELKTGTNSPSTLPPIKMILHCPRCHLQHIDEPDERTPDWTNPPHRSYLCHGCGFIWRPADVPTEGIAAIETRGKADSI